jgi:putative transposase
MIFSIDTSQMIKSPQERVVMSTLDHRFYSERKLPHYQPPGAALFVTFRLAGSIPAACLEDLREKENQAQNRFVLSGYSQIVKDLEQRRLFGYWDHILDHSATGPHWLTEERIAQIFMSSLKFLDGKGFQRIASCIMSNHVHLALSPLQGQEDGAPSLSKYMHSLKGFTAHAANQILGRSGDFWQHESFDHAVKDTGELRRIVDYILNNPVKAGLVKNWENWAWSYLDPEWNGK